MVREDPRNGAGRLASCKSLILGQTPRNIDPDAVTADRILASEPGLREGCHYFNPGYTVTSPEPTLEFFNRVTEAESSWGFQCREARCKHPGMVEYLERHLISCQSFIGSSLFIEGQLLPRRVWNEIWPDLMPPPFNCGMRATWRIPDLVSMAASGDPEPLKVVVWQEIHRHLNASPRATVFVTPGFTTVEFPGCHSFLRDCRSNHQLWRHWLKFALGDDRHQELKAIADLSTNMMVYHGILVVEGRIYVPGLWPGDKVTDHKLARTPFESPTVPLEYLSLWISSRCSTRGDQGFGHELIRDDKSGPL